MKISKIVGGVASVLLVSQTAYGAINASHCGGGKWQNGKCNYTAYKAVNYAKNHYYKNGEGYFVFYTNNCTNFVSQAIAGGFIGSELDSIVYSKVKYYYKPNGWFYGTSTYTNNFPQSPSAKWKGAHELYTYAKTSSPNSGTYFQFITSDSSNTALAFSQIQTGDIIFVDWTRDGLIDHSMIVTKVRSNPTAYSHISVTYQSGAGNKHHKDVDLDHLGGKPNVSTRKKAKFYVYRPIHYKN